MDELSITCHGNEQNAKNFISLLEKKRFRFSLIISYTETSEIPGITIAGANKEFLKFTSPADAEYLSLGKCRCIDTIPMSPDGKPTPALLTKVSLNTAKIPHFVVNAGSMVLPDVSSFDALLQPGKNIAEAPAMTKEDVHNAVDFGRVIGKSLSKSIDCLVIGESIPGGTTTALSVLKGFGIDASVSSSMPKNPIEIKQKTVSSALKRIKSDDPFEIVANLGDPMIPVCTGML